MHAYIHTGIHECTHTNTRVCIGVKQREQKELMELMALDPSTNARVDIDTNDLMDLGQLHTVYIYLSVCLSFYLSIYLSIYLSMYLSICLYI